MNRESRCLLGMGELRSGIFKVLASHLLWFSARSLKPFFLKLFVSSTKDDIIFWWLEFPSHQEKHKLDMDRLHLGGLPGGSGLNFR